MVNTIVSSNSLNSFSESSSKFVESTFANSSVTKFVTSVNFVPSGKISGSYDSEHSFTSSSDVSLEPELQLSEIDDCAPNSLESFNDYMRSLVEVLDDEYMTQSQCLASLAGPGYRWVQLADVDPVIPQELPGNYYRGLAYLLQSRYNFISFNSQVFAIPDDPSVPLAFLLTDNWLGSGEALVHLVFGVVPDLPRRSASGVDMCDVLLHNSLVKAYADTKNPAYSAIYKYAYSRSIPNYVYDVAFSEAGLANIFDKIKDCPKKLKEVYSKKLASHITNTLSSTLGTSLAAIADHLRAVIMGILDPMGILELLYNKILEKAGVDTDKSFLANKWFSALVVSVSGIINLILVTLGIRKLADIAHSRSVHVYAESTQSNLFFNLANSILSHFFPDYKASEVFRNLKEFWETYNSFFTYAGISLAAVTFLVTFLPRSVSKIYFSIFGDHQQKAGISKVEIMDLYRQATVLSVQPGCANNSEFKALVKTILTLIDKLPAERSTTGDYSWADRVAEQCSKWQGQIINNVVAGATRAIPYWVHIFGPSGVGKSSVLLQALLKFAQARFVYRGQYLEGVFPRPNNTTFNNGYKGQEIEVWEEFLNVDDAATKGFILAEALPKLCPTPFLPQIASLDATNPAGCKGTPCGTRMVISLNNRVGFGPISHDIECALARRRNLVIEVEGNPDFYDSSNTLKPQYREFLNDPVKMELKFHIYEADVTDAQIVYRRVKTVDWEGLLQLFLNGWLERQRDNEIKGLPTLKEVQANLVTSEHLPYAQGPEAPDDNAPNPEPHVITLEEAKERCKVDGCIYYPYLNLYPRTRFLAGWMVDAITGCVYNRDCAILHARTNADLRTEADVDFFIPMKHNNATYYLNTAGVATLRFLKRCYESDPLRNARLSPETLFIQAVASEDRVDYPRMSESQFRFNYLPLNKKIQEAYYGAYPFTLAELSNYFGPVWQAAYAHFMDTSAAANSVTYDPYEITQRYFGEIYSIYAIYYLKGDVPVQDRHLKKLLSQLDYEQKVEFDDAAHWSLDVKHETDNGLEVPNQPSLHTTREGNLPPMRVEPEQNVIREEVPPVIAQAPQLRDDYGYACLKRDGKWVLVLGYAGVDQTEYGFAFRAKTDSLTLQHKAVQDLIDQFEKAVALNAEIGYNMVFNVPGTDTYELIGSSNEEKDLSLWRKGGSCLSFLWLAYTVYKSFKKEPIDEDISQFAEAESWNPFVINQGTVTINPNGRQVMKPDGKSHTDYLQASRATLVKSGSASCPASAEGFEQSRVTFVVSGFPYNAIYLGDKMFLTHKHLFEEGMNKTLTFNIRVGDTMYPHRREEVEMSSALEDDLVVLRLNAFRPQATPPPARFIALKDAEALLATTLPYGYLAASAVKQCKNLHFTYKQEYHCDHLIKTIPIAVAYESCSEAGDCGAPLFVPCSGMKVIGLHLAGGTVDKNTGVRLGYSTFLYREYIDDLLHQFHELYPSIPKAQAIEVPKPTAYHPLLSKTSKLIRTEFADVFGDTHVPAILSIDDPNNPDHIDPYAYTVNELMSYSAPPVDDKAFNKAVDDMALRVSTAWKEVPLAVRDQWEVSIDDVVAGRGKTGLEPANHNVCGGFPDSCALPSPYDRFTMEENKPLKPTQAFRDLIQLFVDQLYDGHPPTCYFMGNTKDEVQRPAKRAEGRTRIVYEMSQSQLLGLKYVFHRVLQFFNNVYGREFCHTINAMSHDFHYAVYNYLTARGNTKFIAGDYKSFDIHIHPKFQRAAYQILFSICDVPDRVKNAAIEYLMNPIILTPSKCFQIDHGQFSGNLFTSVCNCMVNCLYVRYAWYRLTQLPFDDHVRMVVCGDDNVISISDYASTFFNGPILAEQLALIGNTYTSDQKDKPLQPWVPFDEITFGGCAPMREHLTSSSVARYVGILTKDRLKHSLSWTVNIQNSDWVFAAIKFAACGYYEDILRAIRKCSSEFYGMHKEVLDRLPDSWNTIRRSTYQTTTRSLIVAQSIAQVPEVGEIIEAIVATDTDDDNLGSQPPEDVISQFFYRDTISIANTDARGTVVYSADIYKLIGTPNNLQTQMLESYAYFSPSVDVLLTYNGQPLTQGLFRCIFVRNVPEDFVLDPDLLFNYPDFIEFHANRDANDVFTIDYQYFKEMITTKKGAGNVTEAYGKFFIVVVSPLNYESGTNMNITLSVSIAKTKFAIPKPPTNLPVAQSFGTLIKSEPDKINYSNESGRALKMRDVKDFQSESFKKDQARRKRSKATKRKAKKLHRNYKTQKSEGRKKRSTRVVKPREPLPFDGSAEDQARLVTFLDKVLDKWGFDRVPGAIAQLVLSNAPVPVKCVGMLYRLIRKGLKRGDDPVQLVIDLINKFGYYDRPLDLSRSAIVSNQPPQALVDAPMYGNYMDYVADDDNSAGRVDILSEQADLAFILGREEIVGNYTWSSNQAANETLGRFALDSVVETVIPSKVGPGRSILNSFKFYKCDWHFRVRVVRNLFQRGALRFITAFGEMDSTKTGYYRDNSYSRILFVEGEEDFFDIVVPYTSVLQYLENRDNYTNHDLNQYNSCGCCALEIVNPLVLSSATVSDHVNVIVTVSFENVSLGCPRPIPPYSTVVYGSSPLPVAQGLGPEAETEEQAPQVEGEEIPLVIDLNPLTSLNQMARREILLPPDYLKVKVIRGGTVTGFLNNNAYYNYVKLTIIVSPRMFFGSNYMRAFRGGLNFRIKISNPRASTVAFYPTRANPGQIIYYRQVLNLERNISSYYAPSFPLETVWNGDWVYVSVPYRSIFTYLNPSITDRIGVLEVVWPSSSNNPVGDFSVFASFADDTSMGTYVPYMSTLQPLGTVADYTCPSSST